MFFICNEHQIQPTQTTRYLIAPSPRVKMAYEIEPFTPLVVTGPQTTSLGDLIRWREQPAEGGTAIQIRAADIFRFQCDAIVVATDEQLKRSRLTSFPWKWRDYAGRENFDRWNKICHFVNGEEDTPPVPKLVVATPGDAAVAIKTPSESSFMLDLQVASPGDRNISKIETR